MTELRKQGNGGERTARVITGHRAPHQPGKEPMIGESFSSMYLFGNWTPRRLADCSKPLVLTDFFK
ncbi:unnamed protein product [Heligmosomoides polygyrus]|uniref:Uncharacterized protein n=1 Tax=Heligmosomoides polygyrus TaxID=6339 RepID=A0A183FAJ7_HELPZ|nr:unnamed protein product [Heligmosomoides polygyrus]